MKSLVAAAVIVLLVSSTASAWTYVAYSPVVVPVPMPYVVNYCPTAPVCASCTPVCASYTPACVYRPVAVPSYTVMRPAPVVYYAPPVPVFYGPPAVVRYKVYYPGQPVRNVLRAVLP